MKRIVSSASVKRGNVLSGVIAALGLAVVAVACSAPGGDDVETSSSALGPDFTCVAISSAPACEAAAVSESMCIGTGCVWGLADNGCASTGACAAITDEATCLDLYVGSADAGGPPDDAGVHGCSWSSLGCTQTVGCPTSADTDSALCMNSGEPCAWKATSATCTAVACSGVPTLNGCPPGCKVVIHVGPPPGNGHGAGAERTLN